MKDFDAITYKDGKGDFNNQDESLLISLLKTNQNLKRILDVGCGDGKLTKRIKDHFPKSEIVAIDNSSNQIAIATSESSSINFELIDIVDYSSESKFDGIYSFYAFPHIPKSKLMTVLKSVKGSLGEGGTFYLFTNICLFDTSKATIEDQEACDIIFLNNWSSQINLTSLEEMKEMFKNAGLNEVQDKKLETGAKIKEYGDMISWMFVLK
jgi:cyclopropane fatty-acyl-phospholipid synthase-like methyltransferase